VNKIQVRLLFHPGVRPEERIATERGAHYFRRFGVICDSAVVGSRAALHQVKAGNKLGGLVEAENPVFRLTDFAHGPLWAGCFTKSICGLGVTPKPLRIQERPDDIENSLGVGITGIGGLVSTDAMRSGRWLDDILFQPAISMLARHELGHILGRRGHCSDDECIMQANAGYKDFVARFVRRGLEYFCTDCRQMISAHVSRAMLGN
jgi:hypothetical protein